MTSQVLTHVRRFLRAGSRAHCLALVSFGVLAAMAPSPATQIHAAPAPVPSRATLYTYILAHDGSVESYDESVAVACLQGLINRKSPQLYVLSRKSTRPQYWRGLSLAGGCNRL